MYYGNGQNSCKKLFKDNVGRKLHPKFILDSFSFNQLKSHSSTYTLKRLTNLGTKLFCGPLKPIILGQYSILVCDGAQPKKNSSKIKLLIKYLNNISEFARGMLYPRIYSKEVENLV